MCLAQGHKLAPGEWGSNPQRLDQEFVLHVHLHYAMSDNSVEH